MRTTTTARRWRRKRRWEDRQWLVGHDPRVLVELQAIADRTESQRDAETFGAARSW
jgi:hypothetical protein